MSDGQSILAIADLLLGAAYADGVRKGEELQAVRDLLKDVLQKKQLPEAIEKRIAIFAPGDFDLAETARELASSDAAGKRRLLELVAAVRDADDELDVAEDEYLVALARALGMKESEYRDLKLEYEVEELRDYFVELASPLEK